VSGLGSSYSPSWDFCIIYIWAWRAPWCYSWCWWFHQFLAFLSIDDIDEQIVLLDVKNAGFCFLNENFRVKMKN